MRDQLTMTPLARNKSWCCVDARLEGNEKLLLQVSSLFCDYCQRSWHKTLHERRREACEATPAMKVALSEAIATALDTPRGKRSRHKPEVFTVEKKSPTPGNTARKKRKQAHKILIAERNKLQATQKKLKSERDELQATQKALESKTDNLEAALEGLKTERAELQASQRSLQAECEEGLSSQRQLEEQLDIQKKITKKHARWRRRWEMSAVRAKEHAKTEQQAMLEQLAQMERRLARLTKKLDEKDHIDGLDLPPEHQYRKMPPTNDALESLLGRQTLFAEQLVNSKTEIDSAYGIFRSNHFIVEHGEVDLDSTKEPPNVIKGMYGLWHKLSLLEKEALADVADRELLQPILERWASRKTQQTENRLLRIDADESLRLRIEMRNRRLLAVVPRIATIQELEERFKEPQSDANRVKWLKHQVRLYRDVYGLDEAKPRSFKVGDKTKVELKEKVASLIRMVTCDPARLQRKEKAAGRRELLKGMTEEMSEYCRKHE